MAAFATRPPFQQELVLNAVPTLPRPGARFARVLAALTLALAGAAAARAATPVPGPARGAAGDAPVHSFAGIERFDGRPGAATARPVDFRAVLDELRRARGGPPDWPDPRRRDFAAPGVPGEIRLGLVDVAYGLKGAGGAAVLAPDGTRRAFAFAPLEARTHRGGDLRFRLEPAYRVADWPGDPPWLEFDAGDGLGFRPIEVGRALRVRYAAPGAATLQLRATFADGGVRTAAATLAVEGLGTPAPDDTLFATGAPYLGGSATGRGYVYLAPGHTAPVNPVLVVEGFDLDNSYGWDELYALLSGENLVESLRADGYDLVVLDFTDATDYVQRNAFVLVDLVDQVRAVLPPGGTIAMVGASMGGLASRYALAWMESMAQPHDVRTFIAFDAPQRGANIPLGIQYWFEFFASESAEAAALRDVLNTPAARQMLVYHFTVPAGAAGVADPLKGVLDAELAALGYPSGCRNVAVANGSGGGQSQGFAPAEQIVAWNYDIGIAVVRGNVWAVPDGGPAQIFDGRQFVLFSTNRTLSVSVSGTAPYDGAPGGSRSSMQQMDETPAPAGDIVALHDSHCFVPTVSALDFDAADLFHDVLGEPDPTASTPFEAIFAPDTNEAHITITPANAAWFRAEIDAGTVAVDPARWEAGLALAASPNPFGAAVRVRYTLPLAGPVRLEVFGLDGRRVATLASGFLAAGTHAAVWDGRDAAGRRQRAGVYFLRLAAPGGDRAARVLLVP